MTTPDDGRPSLYDVLDHYGWNPPGERGGWSSVKCQVHDETRASCRVNYDLGVVRCMACEFKGDVYTVIMHHEGVDFREALTIAGELFNGTDTGARGQAKGRTGSGRSGRTTGGGTAYIPPRMR